jgi:hypothetical protein
METDGDESWDCNRGAAHLHPTSSPRSLFLREIMVLLGRVGGRTGWGGGVGVVAEIFLTDYSESSRPEQRFMTLPHFRCARPCSYRQKALYI